MRLQTEAVEALTFEERIEYRQHLRIINKIICSYSRYDSFVAALAEIIGGDKYTVSAEIYCPNNEMYHFDEEGFMNAYTIPEEV